MEKLIKDEEVTLFRPKENSPHYLEDIAGYGNLVLSRDFEKREDELQWIAEDVKRNITVEELRPDEIAIISLSRDAGDIPMLRKLLQKQGVSSISLTGEGAYDYFTKEGSVTITGIRRAKGNEASLVYVFGFENIGGTQGAVLKRNTAFTAMTRTKGWLCLTGVGQVARELFKEITGTLEKPGMVNFCVPDKSKIERNLETEAKTRKRKKSKKVEKTASKFYEELLDDDVQFYDSESIEKLEELQRLIAQKLNKQQD